jgi:hypothetical protein
LRHFHGPPQLRFDFQEFKTEREPPVYENGP